MLDVPVYPITTGMKYPEGKVFLWRADQKKWSTGHFSDFSHWIGNSNLAYTHWAPMPTDWPPYPERPRES